MRYAESASTWGDRIRRFFELPDSLRERLNTASRYHFLLQNLRLLPLGVFLLLEAARSAGLREGHEHAEMGLMLASCILIQLCYTKTSAYGNSVASFDSPRWKRFDGTLGTLKLCGVMLSAISLLAATLFLDLMGMAPVSLTGIVFSGALFYWWAVAGRFRVHYFVMAAATLLVSILAPLLGLLQVEQMLANSVVASTYLGLIVIVGGVLDHYLLILYTRPIQARGQGVDLT